MSDIINQKKKLRKLIRERLSSLSSMDRKNYSNIIFNKLIVRPEYLNADKLFVYISFDTEVQTTDIIMKALEDNKRVFVPRIKGQFMDMVEISSITKFVMNDYGIVEPDVHECELYDGDVDVVIMPLLGFDRNNSRLGRGGGYYDKFLARKNYSLIAIAYSVQELENIITEKHDVKLDIIITEKEVI